MPTPLQKHENVLNVFVSFCSAVELKKRIDTENEIGVHNYQPKLKKCKRTTRPKQHVLMLELNILRSKNSTMFYFLIYFLSYAES